MKQNKIKIGDVFYRPPHKYKDEITEYKVNKVGKKYFYCDGCSDAFDIATLKYNCYNYSQHSYKLYNSIQEIKDEKRSSDLFYKIRDMFSGYTNKFDLQTLEDIAKILEI